MSNSEPTPQEPAQKQQSCRKTGTQPDELLSSPGNNSPSVTPKDVSSCDASAKDVMARKTCSDDPDEREQEMLDDAVNVRVLGLQQLIQLTSSFRQLRLDFTQTFLPLLQRAALALGAQLFRSDIGGK